MGNNTYAAKTPNQFFFVRVRAPTRARTCVYGVQVCACGVCLCVCKRVCGLYGVCCVVCVLWRFDFVVFM